MTSIPGAVAALLLATSLTVVGCSAQPSANRAEPIETSVPSQTPEQANCETADEFLPTLQSAQAGTLSEEERATARADLTTLLNEKLVEDGGGQVSAMIFVLAASIRDDAAAEDKSRTTFDDFYGQLIDYCEDFASWEMQN
jgi:hypothetical protein